MFKMTHGQGIDTARQLGSPVGGRAGWRVGVWAGGRVVHLIGDNSSPWKFALRPCCMPACSHEQDTSPNSQPTSQQPAINEAYSQYGLGVLEFEHALLAEHLRHTYAARRH